MSYCSPAYIFLFLPLTLFIYGLLPQKGRRVVLLLAGYAFFYILSGKLVVYLLLSTVAIHYFGLWLARLQSERDHQLKSLEKSKRRVIKKEYEKRQRHVIILAVLFHLGMLIILKYGPFLSANIKHLLSLGHLSFSLPVRQLLIPIGISFYTLQALSYLMDVHREKIQADINLWRLALYMNFFPLIMEGPICRYGDTADKLWECPKLTFNNVSFGYQRILYGLMKKMVIADRLNPIIKNIFDNNTTYSGSIVLLGALLYTCQLYMEFSGTMDVVMGTGDVFGITLPENFKRPFFSKNISEFWTRWHITLGTWFRDYIFYPLTMSAPLKKLTSFGRKRLGNHFGPLLSGSIALFCVWLGNGLWHGAGWHYIAFGMYHFILILLGNLTQPAATKFKSVLHLHPDNKGLMVFQMIRTGCLVCIGEIFFRAGSLTIAINMLKSIFTNFSAESLLNGTLLSLGVDLKDYCIVIAAVIFVFILSLLSENGIAIRKQLSKQKLPIRWAAYYSLMLIIIIFGAYGTGYTPVDPIYASF